MVRITLIVTTKTKGDVVFEEVDGVLIDKQRQHLHKGNVLGHDVFVLKVQLGHDDVIDMVVR